MTSDEVRDEVADTLWAAGETRTACAPIRDRVADVDAAYAVQSVNTERRLKAGARLVGRKIGLTSAAVQRQLGVDRPDFGMLFADMAYGDGAPIPADRFIRPRAEAEVALVLKDDLTHGEHTVADVIRAVDFALAAIEIVDSRIAAWDIRLVDTVADNASSGAFVLGATPYSLNGRDLRLAGMVMTRNGREVSTGAGAACLGHPLNAAVWLADTMARTDHPLRAGDVVLTGALGPMADVSPGDVFDARISGLGSVRAVFT
ncbi:2-keto-4-pentenoate hydratase [Rhizohabitans arisaemae]|uniref:2-keto-4-pentenoate hydratase n=1 Tax=Rhizohabitans arisaemae TaxID=2720610 RepID=UPI0024B221BB|nr:fumarylacetoacetate hydrolase family protein [Rhizohabitans arisaemae]